jgi:hypothetical protein
MGNAQDYDLVGLVINLVDDAVIAYSDTPTVGVVSQFGHTVRSGFILQGQESLVDARAYFGGKLPSLPPVAQQCRSAAGRSRTL